MDHGSFDPENPTLVPVGQVGPVTRMQLVSDFRYRDPQGEVFTAEQGYLTDGASIPRFLWSVIGQPYGQYLRAAIIHDRLCDLADESETRRQRQEARRRADLTFHSACLCCGCDPGLAWQLFVGVRIGALLLPWNRGGAAVRPRGGVPEDLADRGPAGAEPPMSDGELLRLWQDICSDALAAGGDTPPPAGSRAPRGGDAPTTLDPQTLRKLDSLVLSRAGLPETADPETD